MFCRCGRSVALIFYYRADQNDLPLGVRVGKPGEQRHIEAFIDYPVVPQPRPGYGSMGGMAIGGVLRLSKVGSIDTARETVNVGMTLSLCPEEARSPSKHDIRDLEQCVFPLQELLGRVLERS